MLDTGNAVLLQLESRRLFWQILCGTFRSGICDGLAPGVDLEHASRVTCLSILFGRPTEAPFTPAARSFMQVESVVAV